MLYEQFYDEINAELQQIAAISREEEKEIEVKKIFIGSGEDCPIIFFGHNLEEISCDKHL